MKISTSILGAQHPIEGQNIQQMAVKLQKCFKPQKSNELLSCKNNYFQIVTYSHQNIRT